MEHRRDNRGREPRGTIGSVAASAVDVVVGPFWDALKMSHRITQGTEGAASETDDAAEVERPSTDADDVIDRSFPEGSESNAESGPKMEDVWGVGPSRAEALREFGIEDVEALAEASLEQIAELSIVGTESAEKIRASARELTGRS